VNRLASTVKNQEHIFLLYALLFTIPGIPSIYYGSEFGIFGKRGEYDDFELRPSLPPFSQVPDFAKPIINSEELIKVITKLTAKKEEPQPAPAPAPEPEPTAEEKLLTEIRDLLKNK
jgi:glycosidase